MEASSDYENRIVYVYIEEGHSESCQARFILYTKKKFSNI